MKEIFIKQFNLLMRAGLGPVLAFCEDEAVFVGVPEGKILGEPFVEVEPSEYEIEIPENYRLYQGITSLGDSEIENMIEGG